MPGQARLDWEDDVGGFWMETLIGMVVMVLLVVLLGPGLWSSRVDLKKSDDLPKDRDSKPGR